MTGMNYAHFVTRTHVITMPKKEKTSAVSKAKAMSTTSVNPEKFCRKSCIQDRPIGVGRGGGDRGGGGGGEAPQ